MRPKDIQIIKTSKGCNPTRQPYFWPFDEGGFGRVDGLILNDDYHDLAIATRRLLIRLIIAGPS